MSTRDLIHRLTTLGEILKMIPGVKVNDDTILKARDIQDSGEELGRVLVRMDAITEEQLQRALSMQTKMRTMTDLEEIARLFADIHRECENAREALRERIGANDTGEHAVK